MPYDTLEHLAQENAELLRLLRILLDCFGDTQIYRCVSCDVEFLDLPSTHPYADFQVCPQCGTTRGRPAGRGFPLESGWRAPDAIEGADAMRRAVQVLLTRFPQ